MNRCKASFLSLTAWLAGCATGSTAPESTDDLRALVCPAEGYCAVESTLEAGVGPDGEALTVVRLRLGDPTCTEGERAYQDWLVATDGDGPRPLRELAFGDSSCLEWEHSAWTFEDDALLFHFGMMGAPAGPGTDTRRTHVRLRPWPLELLGMRRGGESVSGEWSIPERGPLFVLSMDEEGFRQERRDSPEATTPPGWPR